MLSLGLTFWLISIVKDITYVDITNSWMEKNELCFNGVIINKCAEDMIDGWKVFLKSSQRLSRLTSTNATILQSDVNSFFVFENLPWNSQCLAGEIIRASFTACTPVNDTLPKLTAEFQRIEHLCPKITPPTNLKSIPVPIAMVHEDNSTFRASLSITLPVTVEGDWVVYLAVSTQLSKLNAAGVLFVPKQGDIFTLTNLNWQERFIAGVTHILEIEGNKAVQAITKPCIKAVFSSPILSTGTERLQTTQTTYSKTFEESSVNIQISPTIHVQPSSTTTTENGDVILPHECGYVTRPSGYYHLETTVLVLQDWPQGFTGQITFTTTIDVRDGWQVELVMNKAISSINVYTVTTTATSGRRFTFHNKDYNKQLQKGTSVAIDFEATKETVNENAPCMRAVFMWPIEKPCPKITSVSGSNLINATVDITSQWNEGIAGKITVVVPEEIRNGWQMDVLFDIPLTLTVYDAISTPSAGTHFTLTNQSYNKELHTGHILVIDFNAAKQEIGATVLCGHAVFHW